ncbi:MlaD family protein, partial [Patulibacter medicamentivorans]|uniref:MlaD family protein n=1 Tax=Patulibacter medicamentivorans TaxID=1097667 RepID=UPI00058BB9D3
MSAPRRSDQHRSARRWGLAMVAVAALGLALAFGMRAPGSSPTTLRLLTRDAGALRAAGAIRVRVAGTDVGRLTAIDPVPDHPGLTQLTAELRDDAPVVRRDATVKIRPRLFLEGNFFLDLAPGTPGAPPLGGDPLPPSATTIHVATDEIFSLFDANGRRDVRAALRGLSGALARGGAAGLRRAIATLPPALERVA